LLLPLLCPCSSGSSRHLLVFVTASPLPLFQWIEPTSISCLVYRFSSALCCSGSNRRLIVAPSLFPNLRRLRKHRTLSASIGLTACPLSFLSRLRVLYLPWAIFTPLPSCVGCVSTTTPRADTPLTTSPPADCTSTTPGSLEHLRSLDYRATSTSVSTIPLRIASSTFYHLCVDYSFVSTTPYINIFWKCSVLLNISTMSMGYGPRILGRCRPTHSDAIRDSGPQETSGGNLAMHPRSLDSSWRG